MNAGVRTSPWTVRSTPARAAPSVASTRNAVTPPPYRATAGGLTPNGSATSEDQHRVAEAVEAVALLDGEAVEPPRLLDAGERHHEREQRRARQVEVGQQ